MGKGSYIVNHIKRYGVGQTFRTILRKVGVIKSKGVAVDNLPIMKYCQNLTPEQYPEALSEWYRYAVGKELNLQEPRLFTEKIQWLKLYDSTPLKSRLADKYLAPQYVQEKCGDLIQTIPQYGVWDRAEQIDFDSLPPKFVLKCNHGSGMNIVVHDKNALNYDAVRKQLEEWLSLDFAHIYGDFELHYSGIDRKIIAEKYIEEMDGDLHDYKIHCFNGVPKFIQFIGSRDLQKHTGKMLFYDTKWKKLDITTGDYPRYEEDFQKPEALEDMLRAAEILAAPFSYVRIDLYLISGVPYFGEMTFTPAGGCYPKFSAGTDEAWGDMLALPMRKKEAENL